MICVCGSTEYHNAKSVPGVVVDKAGRSNPCSIEVVECKKCGLVRQVSLPFNTIGEYVEYYTKYPPVTSAYQAKDYTHDREVARKRCDAYGIVKGSYGTLLDVGCGSGAFVDECRERGVEAYGCDMAVYRCDERDRNKYIYQNELEAINFPTDSFDYVTCHDVMEHVIDPMTFLSEAFRVTNQNGDCMIEVPNYFSTEGAHHWKKDEHIWFYRQEQLEALATSVGFVVVDVENPIPSKLLLYLKKPTMHRAKILLPPGIGDSYWSLVKLEAFIEKYQTGLPEIYIACNRDRKYDGNNRAFPFVEMLPFVKSSGISISNSTHPELRPIWREAYAHMGRTIFKNVFGCDYFISYNGHLRFGKQLEEVDPDLACDWIPPMFVSLEQERYRKAAQEQYGKYICYYFVFQGTYKYWVDQFPINRVVDAINRITDATGARPVFTGAAWDKDEEMLSTVLRNIKGAVDLRGLTTVEQLFGLMRGAAGVVGYPSGSTIMGTVLGAKTLIIWNDYYNRDFAWYCAPPSTRGKNYEIEFTRKLTAEKLSQRVCDLLGEKKTRAVEKKAPVFLKPKTPMVVATTLNAGYYTADHVRNLRDMVRRGLSVEHTFVCLTDTDFQEPGIVTVPMTHGLPWPWSRLELFRNDLRSGLFQGCTVMFCDLDIMIVRNIDDLAMHPHDLTMLLAWSTVQKHGPWSTDIMVWKGDYNHVLDRYIRKKGVGAVQNFVGLFITNHAGVKPNSVQVIQRGTYSYKHHCLNGLPDDASIVWFHGNPNYTEVKDAWVQEALNFGLSGEAVNE